jgi:CRP-like cAMP-binding protein
MPTIGEGVSAALLAQLPIFLRAPRAELVELARAAYGLHAAPGKVIARRGERIPGLVAVRYGLVQLVLKGEQDRVLRLVGAGETFGEAVLFLDEPLPVEISALADTALVVIPAAPLLGLLERDARFARAMLASLCQRLHAMVMDFEAVTVHGARERIASYLGSLFPSGAETGSARLPVAKQVIASRLGVTKESFSRFLRGFRDERLIEVFGREVRLLDRAGLAAAARGAVRPGAGPA